MQILTKAQRQAVKRIFDRGPIYPRLTPLENQMVEAGRLEVIPITYKQFRRGVQPTFFMDSAVTVQWAGMWLAIETDGYTHS